MHARKTGALIRASVLMAAGLRTLARRSSVRGTERFLRLPVGLAFQIQDDLLDVLEIRRPWARRPAQTASGQSPPIRRSSASRRRRSGLRLLHAPGARGPGAFWAARGAPALGGCLVAHARSDFIMRFDSGMTDEVYQEQILPHVSRTLRSRSPSCRRACGPAVTSAYLLCRIADTIEDEPALSVAETFAFLQRFTAVVYGRRKGRCWRASSSRGSRTGPCRPSAIWCATWSGSCA